MVVTAVIALVAVVLAVLIAALIASARPQVKEGAALASMPGAGRPPQQERG